ncbi:MAG TPA: glycoside hydrolase family 30 beta sandwich domain-containing protein, partial [Deinococcales bacterium]|nr:glycoside hydrolase family 30 beta sandwich domain-containing protein [Deinococcales bacterium]
PWSPPAWMKTNDSLIGGSLRPEAYGPYARYFAAFVRAYEAEGIPVDAVTVQNEPLHSPAAYPGMLMSAREQASFVGSHLGPEFAARGIKTRIIAYDHNWDRPDYPISVLSDPAANPYLAGSAFHAYAGDASAQSTVRDAFPDKSIHFTEITCGRWSRSFADNLKWDLSKVVIGATRNWARTITRWNIALDQNNGPTNGGCETCKGMVTVHTKRGSVTYNVDYYSLGHVSKFVLPGALRVASTHQPGGLESVAFRNPDGSRVAVILNASAGARSFRLRHLGQSAPLNLPAGAVATVRW